MGHEMLNTRFLNLGGGASDVSHSYILNSRLTSLLHCALIIERFW